jgi:hypothetical protein
LNFQQIAEMISEKLLHRFWFDSILKVGTLTTFCGQAIEIVDTGQYNLDQGPDFLFAIIKLGGQTWVGNVEVHIKTSDWFRHKHQYDQNYANTILHVVWQHDFPDFELCPVLILSNYHFALSIIDSHKKASELIVETDTFKQSFSGSLRIDFDFWGKKRLERKAQMLLKDLEIYEFDWDKSVWGWLAKTFGTRVNGMAFYEMAHAIPFWLIKMNRYDKYALEALFLGQLGFLNNDHNDKYLKYLYDIYHEFCQKYNLRPLCFPVYNLRMRPNNFPAIRLSQLAAFISGGYFDLQEIQHVKDITAFNQYAKIHTSPYWESHFNFKRETNKSLRNIGNQMTIAIVVNVFVPYLYAYGIIKKNTYFITLAEKLLNESKPEDNKIIRYWFSKGIQVKNAFQSQAILEFNQFGKSAVNPS